MKTINVDSFEYEINMGTIRLDGLDLDEFMRDREITPFELMNAMVLEVLAGISEINEIAKHEKAPEKAFYDVADVISRISCAAIIVSHMHESAKNMMKKTPDAIQ